jgi:hypothetical protein
MPIRPPWPNFAPIVRLSKPLISTYAELPPDAPLEFPRLGKPYSREELAKTLESVVNKR